MPYCPWNSRAKKHVNGLLTGKHMQNLTKRVYLLECETGTQKGRDIRPGKCPVTVCNGVPHVDHQLVEAQYELGRVQGLNTKLTKEYQYVSLKNQRQEKTILEQDEKLMVQRQENKRKEEVITRQLVHLKNYKDRQELCEPAFPASHYNDCPATHYPDLSEQAYCHQCPCGRGWVRG